MHAESSSAVSAAFRTAVRANAVFCAVSGLAIAGFATPLTRFLGAGSPGLYVGLGIFLAVYGVHLFLTSRRHGVGRAEGWLIVAGDVAWVAASVAVAAAGLLTSGGAAAVLAVAVVVGGFALWQWRALGSGTGPDTVG